jgi:hypothetical protein
VASNRGEKNFSKKKTTAGFAKIKQYLSVFKVLGGQV